MGAAEVPHPRFLQATQGDVSICDFSQYREESCLREGKPFCSWALVPRPGRGASIFTLRSACLSFAGAPSPAPKALPRQPALSSCLERHQSVHLEAQLARGALSPRSHSWAAVQANETRVRSQCIPNWAAVGTLGSFWKLPLSWVCSLEI